MSPAGRRSGPAPGQEQGLQVVVFEVGGRRFAAPREQVKAIRESPRVRSRLKTGTATIAGEGLHLLSLSTVLGYDRDTSVDRRVLEVELWGRRLGLEVTTIEGIRDVAGSVLHVLPPLIGRNLKSANVLGILEWLQAEDEQGQNGALGSGKERVRAYESPTIAIDLIGLLVEQGVEVPEEQPS